MNDDNLRVPSTNEARKIGSKGGVASGEARKRKKTFQELIKWALCLPLQTGDADEIESMADVEGKNMTAEQAIVIAQVMKAMGGDTRSAEWIVANMPKETMVDTSVNDAFMKSLGWSTAKLWGEPKKPVRRPKKGQKKDSSK